MMFLRFWKYSFHLLLVFIDIIYISIPILQFKYALCLFQESKHFNSMNIYSFLLYLLLGAGDPEIYKTGCLSFRLSESRI